MRTLQKVKDLASCIWPNHSTGSLAEPAQTQFAARAGGATSEKQLSSRLVISLEHFSPSPRNAKYCSPEPVTCLTCPSYFWMLETRVWRSNISPKVICIFLMEVPISLIQNFILWHWHEAGVQQIQSQMLSPLIPSASHPISPVGPPRQVNHSEVKVCHGLTPASS